MGLFLPSHNTPSQALRWMVWGNVTISTVSLTLFGGWENGRSHRSEERGVPLSGARVTARGEEGMGSLPEGRVVVASPSSYGEVVGSIG